jgi:arylsulfatase A-like enzyme
MNLRVLRLILFLGVVLVPGALAEDRLPNIVFILSDDQGWNDIGYHNSEMRTPHLDRLAKEGLELDCHYVQPQCTPTRVAFSTGRYPSRFGSHCTTASNERSYERGH